MSEVTFKGHLITTDEHESDPEKVTVTRVYQNGKLGALPRPVYLPVDTPWVSQRVLERNKVGLNTSPPQRLFGRRTKSMTPKEKARL